MLMAVNVVFATEIRTQIIAYFRYTKFIFSGYLNFS